MSETVVKEINTLVEKGLKALDDFMHLNQKQIDYIVAKCSVAGLDHHGILAASAIEETKRGVFEDKATKNLFACEYVVNNMRHLKTVDVISEDPVTGITEIASPMGVICGITPVTNPTSTVIFKTLICLKTRNPIIFAFHPSAQQCSKQAAEIIYQAALAAGAPENCIQWIEKPSMAATTALMNHEGVATILATGGNSMVKAAYSCGKPAMGVGAGNVPAYINASANIEQAVNDIVLSKAFDNGMVCASEQACIVDEEIYDETVRMFKKYKAYFASKKEKKMLEKFLFNVESQADYPKAVLNPNAVGKPITWIAREAGFEVSEDTSIICVQCSEVGVNEPLSREKLSSVLAFIKVKDAAEGFEKSKQMVEFYGLGHSAAIHCKDKEMADEFGRVVKAMRIIWNSPATFGGIGNVYNSFLPSMTLGCGTY
ncbi:MAG TPA: aldehyde dehydrogenase family protein, partial [Erysipelotrichaceae bacterium]|nr:aldehyde dehydrogenase family protein [Erysipelotrichaceae bacterium]